MSEAKFYNVEPAKGQALLKFQGRLMPKTVELFEAEKIEEVRQDRKGQKTLGLAQPKVKSDFTNLLIQGDCLSACAYLKSKNIRVDLVYIDPPFASGANYTKKIYLRNGGHASLESDDSSIGEEIMYGDIWQKEDYLNWLYERLLAIREVMSEDASIYVHLDWHIGHYAKILMDEIFGEANFIREIIWNRMNPSGGKAATENWIHVHDNILFYVKTADTKVFNKPYTKYSKEYIEKRFVHRDENGKLYRLQGDNRKQFLEDSKGKGITSVWEDVDVLDISDVNVMANERQFYTTQKPESLLERIIRASSADGMVVADFFSGSGTTAKVANDLGRHFIATDVGINAVSTTRDRLAKAGAKFDVLKVKDGVKLFRNPAQTTQKIFSLLDGFKSREELDLSDFWDGGIAEKGGSFMPVKFIGLDKKLTKPLLDVVMEEIYQLEDSETAVSNVKIIFAHRAEGVDQKYLDKEVKESGKTSIKVELLSLDDLLAEKKNLLYTEDSADVKVSKEKSKTKVEIKRFFSSYLKDKIDEYNATKVKKADLLEKAGSKVKISSDGLELIEAVQFDTTLRKDGVWVSNLDLEDRAGVTEKIKGVYQLDTDKFRMKIRNIAGDEIILDSAKL